MKHTRILGWSLFCLTAVLTVEGCAQLPSDVDTDEQTLTDDTRTTSQASPGVMAPSTHTPIVSIPGASSGQPELEGINPLCECHWTSYGNRGLICFRVECSSGCSQHERDCFSIYGGCVSR